MSNQEQLIQLMDQYQRSGVQRVAYMHATWLCTARHIRACNTCHCIFTHTNCYAFINSTCFSLTARNGEHHTGCMWKNQQHDGTDAGEFRVLSLPNPIHITLFLNWHFHKKELNHFTVNIRLYSYDPLLKSGVSCWLQQGPSWAISSFESFG